MIALLFIGIILWARKDRVLLTLAIAAPILLVIQIVLGGLTVLWKLPPQVITAHLATALAIFAIVITIAVLSGKPAPSKELPAKTRKFAQLAISNALLVYILMLLGSYVTGSVRRWPVLAGRSAHPPRGLSTITSRISISCTAFTPSS